MSMKNIDMALCSYLDDLFFHGKQIWEARYAVYGTIWLKQLVRHCPHTLPRAREALLGWGKASPEVVGDPLPWEAALLIAQHMADSGTPTGLAGARAVLVGFDGYLRPAETLGIRKSDVTINRRNTVLRYPTITLTIAPQRLTPDTGDPPPRRTKAGHHDDTIIIGDEASRSAGRGLVVGILRLAFNVASANQLLFNLDLNDYQALFRSAVRDLKLQKLKPTPHGLRHGGPSTDAALQVRSRDDIRKRGRWQADVSVRRYEKSGKLTRQIALLSVSELDAARRALLRLPQLLGHVL